MSSAPENLESYLSGRWLRGEGIETRLVDPVKGDELATVSAKGVDLKGALDFARKHGQGGLRGLSYAERGKLVGAVADVLVANRARYEDIAIANSGNTKTDAAIDIDGGIGTLKYYARLGGGLGDARTLLDEKPVRLAKAENYQAIHLMVPRRGVAVHINAFTGSADTAARVRGHPNVVARSVPVNIEADSINAALLAPESSPGSTAFDAFLREVVREMTVKAGQKCTAIRRIFVPAGKADAVADALAEKLQGTKVGDPRQAETRMGPLVTRGQQAAALDGIRRLASEAAIVCGGADAPTLDGIDKNKSAFVAPTLLRLEDAGGAQAVHEVEVFGPAATIVPYRDEQDAAGLIARGGGSLVASVYGEDKDFLVRIVREIAPSHGRILAVDPAIATAHTGHGIVMPQCNHGGPGRAGAGEELGGLHGLRFYHQRLAVQGSSDLIASLQAKAASVH